MNRKINKNLGKNRKNKSFVIKSIQLICVILIMFSSMEIYKWVKENNENRDALGKLQNIISKDTKNDKDNKINYNVLQSINSDIVAWIKINNTNVDYPVVQTENNEFYLNHNIEKNENKAGWIFMDYRNNLNSKDKNIIIYGHNRMDGSMFSSLKNLFQKQWYENEQNLKIQLITESETLIYQIFSIYEINNEDYYITTGFENNEKFNQFLNKIKSRSIKNFEVNVSENDQILTLSTCSSNNKDRYVVHAKKVLN